MQHAGNAKIERCGVKAARFAGSCGLHAHNAHLFIVNKRMKHANGIGSAAHAGHNCIRKLAGFFHHLGACFTAYDALQFTHQQRKRMRPRSRAKAVMGCFLAAYPGAQGFVNGVLEGARAAFHRVHGGAEQLHAHDVGSLALHVFRPHIDGAFQPQPGRRGRRGNTVLARPCFSHQSRLAHMSGKQGLTQGIVDLVRASVQQVLTLEPEIKTQFP